MRKTKFAMHQFQVFKWLFYLAVILALISLVIYLALQFETDTIKNQYQDMTRKPVPYDASAISPCLDKNDYKKDVKNILKSLKICWAIKDADAVNHLVNESMEIANTNSAEIVTWLREMIDNDASFYANDKVHLPALNKIIATSDRKKDYPSKTKDREYLLSVIKKNKSDSDAFIAIAVLGYFANDADIPIFVQHAKSDKEIMMMFSVHALLDSCSPKAIEALQEISSDPSVKEYVRNNDRCVQSAVNKSLGIVPYDFINNQ
jgi:uncharacterized protein (UPF0147 family)